MLTQERLKELLHYDPDTGIFTRLVSRPCTARKGSIANSINNQGYKVLKIDGISYKQHRLAWFNVHGVWPTHEIDHINADRSDNRIENLRDIPHQNNCENKHRARKDNRLNVQGVKKHGNRYETRIQVKGKYIHLGVFDTPDEAHTVYLENKRLFHTFNR